MEFKKKHQEDAFDLYEHGQLLDANNKVFSSNMVACLIELKSYDDALNIIENIITVFETEQVDIKVRARLLQRKGTIHLKKNELLLAIESFKNSLKYSKTKEVSDLLLATQKLVKLSFTVDSKSTKKVNQEDTSQTGVKEQSKFLKKYIDENKLKKDSLGQNKLVSRDESSQVN